MNNTSLVIMLVNLGITFTLFLVLFYKFWRDKHYASLSWSMVLLVLSLWLAAKAFFLGNHMDSDFYFFLMIIGNAYMGLMIAYSTFMIIGEELSPAGYIALCVLSMTIPIWGFFAVEYVNSVFWRIFPTQALSAVAQLLSVLVIILNFSLKGRPVKFRLGIRMLYTGLLLSGLNTLIYPLYVSKNAEGLNTVLAIIFKLITGIGLIFFLF